MNRGLAWLAEHQNPDGGWGQGEESPQMGGARTSQGIRARIGVGEGRVVYYADRVEIRLLSAIGYARVTAPSLSVAMQFVRGLSAR